MMIADYYRPKKISELKGKNDSKVAVIGKVVEAADGKFVLDDATGRVEVVSDAAVSKDATVRAFCSIEEDKLKADVVQNLSKFDLNLFNKSRELYEQVGV